MIIFAILSLLMAVAILIFVVWLNFKTEKTIKEFDRMHKNNFMTPEVRKWIINQIAKEMVEEK